MPYCRECCGSGTDYKNNGDPDERRWDCPHCQGTGLEPTLPAAEGSPVWCEAVPVQPPPPRYRIMRICSHCGWERPDGTACPNCDPPVVHHAPHGWCKRAMPTMFIEGHEAECQARPDTKVKTLNQGE